MKVLVCGGRDYADFVRVGSYLAALFEQTDPDDSWLVIHGGAPGADTLAAEWARACGGNEVCCPANWNLHGKKAGPIRNQAMLALRPDVVLAFPGGKGTADMVRRAKQHNVRVIEVDA